jgi:GNAT superfamily N-acetyltransferase
MEPRMSVEAQDTVIVREATQDDLAAIRAVVRAANEEFRAVAPVPFFPGYLASALDLEGRMVAGELLVVEWAGQVAGTVTFYADANDEGMGPGFPPRTAGLRATAVHPRWRGRGLGRRLVAECVARSSAVGATSLALHTAEFMRAAIAMYVHAGFRREPAYDFPALDFFARDEDGDLTAIAFLRPIR